MRVALLTPTGRIGGAERVLLDLAAGLRQERPDWQLHALVGSEGPLTEALAREGVATEVLALPSAVAKAGDAPERGHSAWRALAAAPALLPHALRARARLSRLRPDLVHANGLKADLVAALAAPREARVVWHLHDYLGDRPLARRLLRFAARRADLVIANSESVAADARRWLGERVPVTAVPNGVDLDRFRPEGPRLDLDALARLPPPPAGTVRVGLVALFGRWKGQDLFLEALAALPPDDPVRGYVIGGPAYAAPGSQFTLEELRQRAIALGLGDRVGFTGPVDDSAAAFRSLDIAVHASRRREPFGLVVAEAMACGCAVVARREGGVAEVLREGEGIGHDGTALGLAASIVEPARDRPRRELLAAAALVAAEARLSRPRFVRQMVAAWQRVTLAPSTAAGSPS